jgi:hypothetical protein
VWRCVWYDAGYVQSVLPISPYDPVITAGSAFLLLAVRTAACPFRARRAAAVVRTSCAREEFEEVLAEFTYVLQGS